MNELLAKIADRMRRCDPEYCESHSVDQTTDEEWDELLAEVEDACDEDRESPVRVQGAADVHQAMGRSTRPEPGVHPIATAVWDTARSAKVCCRPAENDSE